VLRINWIWIQQWILAQCDISFVEQFYCMLFNLLQDDAGALFEISLFSHNTCWGGTKCPQEMLISLGGGGKVHKT